MTKKQKQCSSVKRLKSTNLGIPSALLSMYVLYAIGKLKFFRFE